MSVKIPECDICGLPAVYKCLAAPNDHYCSEHAKKKDCCYLMPFPDPKPKFTVEEKWY